MGLFQEPFKLTVGGGPSRYYPAHIPIKDRGEPGLRFALEEGRPWQWIGSDGPIEVRLVDVLAAATMESLNGHDSQRRAVLGAHACGLVGALRCGLADLAERLAREQEAVLDTVDEWQLGGLTEPPLLYRTVKNYKLNVPRRVPPPIQVVGNRHTIWLWARTQAIDWIEARPGSAWRSGLSDADIAASGRRLPGRPRRQAGR